MSDTSDVLQEVQIERGRQDDKWGGPEHDDHHTAEHWCGFIRQRVSSIESTPDNERRHYLEIAALAVAAIESYDRQREDGA